MARKNIWEHLWESTEGPTVTVTIPRDHAESLLQILASSLEQDMPDDMSGDDDLDSVDDLDFGDDGDMDDFGGPPDGDMDDLDMPAGDDDDDMDLDLDADDDSGPPKRGPGRPPGAKNKKKSDSGDKKKDKPKKDDGGKEKDDDAKEESAGEFRPQTALGESAFARAARALAAPRRKR